MNSLSNSQSRIADWYLILTSFITGAAVLVLEIVGSRIISPYFGVSIVVWSSLITVTLLSLAAGYWAGGLCADMHPHPERIFSIVLASAVFIATLPWLGPIVISRASSFGLRSGALLSAAELFAVPLALLGMVCPFIVKILAGQGALVGRKTGMVYAVSTVGSFCGAILTGFFIVPSFHVHTILFGVAFCIALTTVYPALALRSKARVALLCLFIIGVIILVVIESRSRSMRPNAVAQVQSVYGEISVVDDGTKRTLLINGIGQGSVDRSGMPVERYFYVLDRLAAALNPAGKHALVIGLGTGALPRILSSRAVSVDTVEIDPVVADLSRRFFGYREEGGSLVLSDARYFLDRKIGNYDSVFLDAYASEMIPYHLFSREAFRAVRSVIASDGLFAINLHDYRDTGKGLTTRSIVTTLRSVFPAVMVFEVQSWHDGVFRNIVVLAKNSELSVQETLLLDQYGIPAPAVSLPEGQLLTDGDNPIEWLSRPVSEAMRTASLRAYAE